MNRIKTTKNNQESEKREKIRNIIAKERVELKKED